jgi:hypothetical protein
MKLPNGISSAGTILRVLGRIDQRKVEKCFRSRTRGCFKERMRTGSVTALDGKTVRGSGSGERKAVHSVSAWADELGLVLGQVPAEKESNKTTAAPALLEALDISGCMAAIDALGCQKAAAQAAAAEQGG